MTIRAMLYYNVFGRPREALSYNAVFSADCEASYGSRWAAPLGLR